MRGQISHSNTVNCTSSCEPTGHCQMVPAPACAHDSIYLHITCPLLLTLLPSLAQNSLCSQQRQPEKVTLCSQPRVSLSWLVEESGQGVLRNSLQLSHFRLISPRMGSILTVQCYPGHMVHQEIRLPPYPLVRESQPTCIMRDNRASMYCINWQG